MSTGANKMDSSEVYSMFETVKELIIKQEKQKENPAELAEQARIDTVALNAVTERLEAVAEEIH